MPFLIIIPLAFVAGIVLGYILSEHPPEDSIWIIHIESNELTFEGASLGQWKKQSLAEVLRQCDIEVGFIARDSTGRIVFSESIPEDFRQRLRNILS